MRKWLITLRFWFRYRRVKRLLNKATVLLDDQKLSYEKQIAKLKMFYEERLAIERLARQRRDDGFVDAFLQRDKLNGISHRTLDLQDKINLPPDVVVEQKNLEYDLTPDQQAYVEDYKSFYYENGRIAGKTDAEINQLWNLEGYRNAIITASENME